MMRLSILSGCLCALNAFIVPAAAHAGEFHITPETLTLPKDASTATLTVDEVTLTFDAGKQKLAAAQKGKVLGIAGHKSGLLNAEEQLILTFDKDVVLSRIDLAGLGRAKGKKEASDEKMHLLIPALKLDLEVTPEGAEGCEFKHGRQLIFNAPLAVPAGSEIILQAVADGGDFGLSGIVTNGGEAKGKGKGKAKGKGKGEGKAKGEGKGKGDGDAQGKKKGKGKGKEKAETETDDDAE